MPRKFDILDILSVTTDMLLSQRHMDGLYDLLNYMTDDNLYTHQLGRAANECRPVLLQRHPVLADPKMAAAVAEINATFKAFYAAAKRSRHTIPGAKDADLRPAAKKIVDTWKAKLISGKFGFDCPETLMISPLAAGEHEYIDPQSELAERVPPERIIIIEKP